MIASSTASEIWSHILSGCPSVTDSEVKKNFGELAKVVVMFVAPIVWVTGDRVERVGMLRLGMTSAMGL